AGPTFDVFHADRVCRFHVAGIDAADLALAVDRDVDEEIDADAARDSQAFLVARIAFEDAAGGAHVAHDSVPMETLHGFQIDQRGAHALAPARIAGHEMR